jgi:hypothetical protein
MTLALLLGGEEEEGGASLLLEVNWYLVNGRVNA